MEAQVFAKNRLLIDGHVYYKHQNQGKRTFWICVKRNKSSTLCSARASTPQISKIGEKTIVLRGPKESPHNHPPDPREIELAGASPIHWKRRILMKKPALVDERTRSSKVDKEPTLATGKMRVVKETSEQTKSHLTDASKSSAVNEDEDKRDDGCAAADHETDFTKDPVKYREFLLKFTEKPSFDRESIIRALDAVSNLGISRTAACALVQSNQSKIAADLDELSSTIITSLAPSPAPSVASTIAVDVSATDTSDVPNSEAESACHTPTRKKKKRLGNEKMMDLLQSTFEATFKTVQHFTEYMAEQKDKKKRRKEKRKEREERHQYRSIRVKIIPPVPDATPIENTHFYASPPVSTKNPAKHIRTECPLIDLTDDFDPEMSHCNGSQSNARIETASCLANTFFNAPTVPGPLLNCCYPTPRNLAPNDYLEGHQYAVSPIARDFPYLPVPSMQPPNSGCHPLNWNSNYEQASIQNFMGMNNGFLSEASRHSTSQSIPMDSTIQMPR